MLIKKHVGNLMACAFAALIGHAATAAEWPSDGDLAFKRAGTLVPRSKPDPNDDQ